MQIPRVSFIPHLLDMMNWAGIEEKEVEMVMEEEEEKEERRRREEE